MARLRFLQRDTMKYPYGRCAECDEVFDFELRKREITHCPYCGTEIDDFLSCVDSSDERAKRNDLFCEDCGRRVYESGRQLIGSVEVCKSCGRMLCGNCACWHPSTKVCADCHEAFLKDDPQGLYRALLDSTES